MIVPQHYFLLHPSIIIDYSPFFVKYLLNVTNFYNLIFVVGTQYNVNKVQIVFLFGGLSPWCGFGISFFMFKILEHIGETCMCIFCF